MSNVVFCTCNETGCPNHPTNHDKGCTPCIEKNLREREIPACFFKKAGGVKPTEGWHFEDFAALINANSAEIVPATESDKEEVMALYRAQLGREFCPWNEYYPSYETIDDDLSRDALFVMKENGRIIASISIDKDDAVEALECWSKELAPGGELSRLAVSPEMQNRGIARKMATHGMALLKERGFKSIHFLVNRHNKKALQSYSHLGFNKVGECFMYNQEFLCYEKELV